MIPIVHEERERRCGRRKPGGIYAVSPSAALVGGVTVHCDVAVVDPPVPIPPDFGSRRGYVYVDGAAILERRPAETWRIEPNEAHDRRTAWAEWGMDLSLRATSGVCAGVDGASDPAGAVRRHLVALTTFSNLESCAEEVHVVVCGLRATAPSECPIVPAILVDSHLQDEVATGFLRASRYLARAWQIAHAVRWAKDLPDRALHPLQALMSACGAVEDAAFLRDTWPKGRDPRRLVPDLLDWVGARDYPTDEAFLEEAIEEKMGASRRMASFPRAAEPGVSRVFLAHPNCVAAGGTPAVFGFYYVSEFHYILERHDEPAPRDLLVAGVVPVVPVEI